MEFATRHLINGNDFIVLVLSGHLIGPVMLLAPHHGSSDVLQRLKFMQVTAVISMRERSQGPHQFSAQLMPLHSAW